MTEPAEPPPPPTASRPWATHVLIPPCGRPNRLRRRLRRLPLAVVELLNNLREAVNSLYAQQIQDLVRDEQGHGDAAGFAADGDDLTNHRQF